MHKSFIFCTFAVKILIFCVMTNKERYAEWCQTQERLPLFMHSWWMDAVCAGKEWDVLLIRAEQCEIPDADKDAIVAAMPYLIRRRWRIHYIVMPQETQTGGLWLDENRELTASQIRNIVHVVEDALVQLKLSYYYQQFPSGSPCPDIFREDEFKVKERVTYRIEDLSNLDLVIGRFSKNKKRQLQKALSLHAEVGMDVEAFYRFHCQCMEARKRKISYTREFLLLIERKAARLKQCEIIRICNADGQVYAAAFVVWDTQRMYYLMPCYDPQFRDSGASSLLVLEAIKLAREKGVQFDFEGSNERGIANHYKQFGSEAFSYYSVSKLYKWWFWFALLINKIRNLRYGI